MIASVISSKSMGINWRQEEVISESEEREDALE